mmetsp:Transcript_8676/g.19681  ORF Transcript_8676/g.19681 Transcript_8676/m.19681 type:complete len:241 (+) Transcript_8676:2019-2741(+)
MAGGDVGKYAVPSAIRYRLLRFALPEVQHDGKQRACPALHRARARVVLRGCQGQAGQRHSRMLLLRLLQRGAVPLLLLLLSCIAARLPVYFLVLGLRGPSRRSRLPHPPRQLLHRPLFLHPDVCRSSSGLLVPRRDRYGRLLLPGAPALLRLPAVRLLLLPAVRGPGHSYLLLPRRGGDESSGQHQGRAGVGRLYLPSFALELAGERSEYDGNAGSCSAAGQHADRAGQSLHLLLLFLRL